MTTSVIYWSWPHLKKRLLGVWQSPPLSPPLPPLALLLQVVLAAALPRLLPPAPLLPGDLLQSAPFVLARNFLQFLPPPALLLPRPVIPRGLVDRLRLAGLVLEIFQAVHILHQLPGWALTSMKSFYNFEP